MAKIGLVNNDDFYSKLLFYWNSIELYQDNKEIQNFYIWRLEKELGIIYNG